MTDNKTQAILIVLEIIGYVVAFVTLIKTANARKTFYTSLNKKDFNEERKMLIDKMNGFYYSILDDGLYNKTTVERLYLLISEIKNKYLFFDRKTKKALKALVNFINTKCAEDFTNKQKTNKLELCNNLKKIVIFIEREETVL